MSHLLFQQSAYNLKWPSQQLWVRSKTRLLTYL